MRRRRCLGLGEVLEMRGVEGEEEEGVGGGVGGETVDAAVVVEGVVEDEAEVAIGVEEGVEDEVAGVEAVEEEDLPGERTTGRSSQR